MQAVVTVVVSGLTASVTEYTAQLQKSAASLADLWGVELVTSQALTSREARLAASTSRPLDRYAHHPFEAV